MVMEKEHFVDDVHNAVGGADIWRGYTSIVDKHAACIGMCIDMCTAMCIHVKTCVQA